jgi:hypothetical protein
MYQKRVLFRYDVLAQNEEAVPSIKVRTKWWKISVRIFDV